MPSNIHQHFLHDLSILIRERATQAKQERNKAHGTDQEVFTAGQAMAWYEVASLIEQQAAAFGIDPKELGLDDFDPERDLL